MRRNEFLVAVLVVALLALSWGLDRLIPARSTPTAVPTPAAPLLSEGWYCPTPVAQVPGSDVLTADLGDGPVHLRRAGTGGPAEADVTTGAVAVAPALASPVSSTVSVEAFGQPTVSQIGVLSTSAGAAMSRCSNQPATRWLFALASTAAGEDTYLVVANPFREAAAVTVRELGPNGDQVPSGLSDLQVPATSQLTIFLGDYIPATASFGLDVTASRGRVVVQRLVKAATRDGLRGLSLDVGVSQPATQWYLAGGGSPAQGEEDLLVANPSDHEALISLSYQVESGPPPAGQQQVPVPSGSEVAIKLSDVVPAGTQHGTIVSSTNAVPVVVERQTIAGQGAARSFQSVFAVPASAARWALVAGSSVGGTDTLAVIADGQDAAVFSVTLLTPTGTSAPPDLASLKVDPGTRFSLDLTPRLGGQPAVVVVSASSGRIAVENNLTLPASYREVMGTEGLPLP